MIKQKVVAPAFRPDIPENQTRFLQDLSESLQGLMQPQEFKQPDGGLLEVMAFGPLVLIRYDGAATEVALPFQPDGDMPLSCWPPGVLGRIKADRKRLEFSSADGRVACGWCISRGTEFGKKGGA